jgi:hypothetical protein
VLNVVRACGRRTLLTEDVPHLVGQLMADAC